MPEWNPSVYLEFARERTQPSIDLVRRIELEAPKLIVDLGCGPGNSTAVLRQRWPKASIVGVDSSIEMIRTAEGSFPEFDWVVGDAATWKPSEPQDLIYSNAMLQWLPDHAGVCRHLYGQLAPGGALAVQVPAHYDSALHSEILEVSRDPAWDSRMRGARSRLTNEPPALYYGTLAALGARVDLWETTYYHVVAGPEAVVQWFRGTGMRPFLEALSSADERVQFEAALLERYTARYPRQADGRVLFLFKRLFFIAYHG